MSSDYASEMDDLTGRNNYKQNRLIGIVLLVTVLSVTPIGYHIIVLNVPSTAIEEMISKEMNIHGTALDFVWSFIVACQSMGALLSGLLVVPLEKKFGAKKTLMVFNAIVLLIGSIAFAFSKVLNVMFMLIAGRLLIGVHTGIAAALVPMYIQEVVPEKLKGALCCFVHISIIIGSGLAALLSLDFILGKHFHILLAIPAIFSFLQFIYDKFLPETPNYLLRVDDEDRTIQSIKFYYSLSGDLDHARTIKEYRSRVPEMPKQMPVKEAFKDPKIRDGIWLGVFISMTQIFSGSIAAVSYSTSMLDSVSFASNLTPYVPVLGAVVSILLTLPAVCLVERCGRKRLLLSTLFICTLANYLLAIFALLSQNHGQERWASIAFIASFLMYGTGYNLGVGPVAYFIPGELVPPQALSVAMGTAVSFNWLSIMLTTLIYYPLNKMVGGWSFLMFAIPTTFALFYLNRALPSNASKNAINDDREEMTNKPSI